MCRRVTLFPVPLRPRMTNPLPLATSNETSSRTARVPKALRHAVEPHSRRSGFCGGVGAHPPAALGKMKKISRTRMTLATMIPTEENTTARVDARPTPSVPDSVVIPR